MKYLILPLFLMLTHTGVCQLGIKGSYFIIAKASDGIMIAADSRGNFYNLQDSTETPIAYYDSVQKIFVVGNNIMAFMGKELFGDVLTSTIINGFIKNGGDKVPVTILIKTFMDFCKAHLRNYALMEKGSIAAVGYENNKSYISYYQYGFSKGIVTSDTINMLSAGKSAFNYFYDKKYSCWTLGELADMSIPKYSKDKNMFYEIGGPIRIISLTPNGATWIKNKPTFNYLKIDDFFNDYKNRKAEMIFITPSAKEIFEKEYPQLKRN